MPFQVRDQSRVCRFHWGLVGIAYCLFAYLITRIINSLVGTLISWYARTTKAKKGALDISLGCGWPWFWEVCLCWGCSCGGGMSFLSNYDVRTLLPNYHSVLTFLWYFKILRRPDDFINAKRAKYGLFLCILLSLLVLIFLFGLGGCIFFYS